MPSLKAVRLRIASVKSTQKITRAMKLVAAAKLRRITDVFREIQPDVSAHMNFQMAERSLTAAVAEIAQILAGVRDDG